MIIECVGGATVEIAETSLVAARLDGLNLHRALLDGRSMQRVSGVKTDFRGAFMNDANLDESTLIEASLITAFLMRTSLRRAILDGGRAIGSRFDEADLTEASFVGVDVGHASFAEARLHGAKMLCQRIELALFTGATYDARTLWPPGFDPTAAGAVFEPSSRHEVRL